MSQYVIVIKLNASNKCVPINPKSQDHSQICIVNAQQRGMSSSFKCVTRFFNCIISFRIDLYFGLENYILAKAINTTSIYRLWL